MENRGTCEVKETSRLGKVVTAIKAYSKFQKGDDVKFLEAKPFRAGMPQPLQMLLWNFS